MSEDAPEYKVTEYKVTDQPAAIIESPRKVLALAEGGLVDYSVWGWVKTSAKFRAHIKILRGAKHDIWHYLALGVDETGKCKETIKEICEGTGYSHTEVINTLKELDELGYLSVQRDGKGNIYTPEFVARGERQPTEKAVKKVESTPVYQVDSTPPLEESPSIPLRVKRVNTATPQNMPIEWYVQHDLPVPPELTQTNAAEVQAIHEFESAFGFNQLPWDTTSDWQAFKKWVVKIYQSAPADFREYVEWRSGNGKYDAMSNKQIRLTPRAFMDTGYPTFKASAMYAKKTDETRPEYKPYKPEEKNYVPRPATIKPVIRKPAE